MIARTSHLRALLVGAALSVLAAAPAGAQAFSYPAFQLPRIVPREFNFGFADSDGATSLLFQWREAQGTTNQLSLDVGFADVDGRFGDDNVLFFGGQFAHQLTTASAEMPFDLLFTVGANLALYDEVNIFRVPVGVVAGRRFPIEGGLAITPFVHPRLGLARCSECGVDNDGNRDSNTELGIEFDIGVDFQFNPQFSLRLAGGFGDDEVSGDSFGVSLAWYPGRARSATRR